SVPLRGDRVRPWTMGRPRDGASLSRAADRDALRPRRLASPARSVFNARPRGDRAHRELRASLLGVPHGNGGRPLFLRGAALRLRGGGRLRTDRPARRPPPVVRVIPRRLDEERGPAPRGGGSSRVALRAAKGRVLAGLRGNRASRCPSRRGGTPLEGEPSAA